MKRRDFIIQSSIAGSSLLILPSYSGFGASGKQVKWTRSGKLFSSVTCDGNPLLNNNQLLDATLKLTNASSKEVINIGTSSPSFQNPQFIASLEHRLYNSNNKNGEDLLQATLTISNLSTKSLQFDAEFVTSAQPSIETEKQRVYIPLCLKINGFQLWVLTIF